MSEAIRENVTGEVNKVLSSCDHPNHRNCRYLEKERVLCSSTVRTGDDQKLRIMLWIVKSQILLEDILAGIFDRIPDTIVSYLYVF